MKAETANQIGVVTHNTWEEAAVLLNERMAEAQERADTQQAVTMGNAAALEFLVEKRGMSIRVATEALGKYPEINCEPR